MELNFDNTCRSCLAENEEMVSLFEVYDHDLSLAMILESCLSFKVNEDDGLPSNLCHNCILVLTQSYNFTVIYEQSDRKLKSLLKKSKRNIEAIDDVAEIRKIASSNDFTENDLVLADSSEEFDITTTVIEISPEAIESENLEYYTIKNDNFYTEQVQEANDVNHGKEDDKMAVFINDFKKEPSVNNFDVANSNSNIAKEAYSASIFDDLEIKQEQVLPKIEQERESIMDTEYENITKYQCPICTEAHLYAIGFQQHMLLKHAMPDIECKDYAKQIRIKVYRTKVEPGSRLASSSVNSKISNDVNELKYRCEQCHKAYPSDVQLIQHRKLHDLHKKYICEICGISFIRKNYLVDHMEGHSTERKHKCKYCGKCYRRRTVLRAHKRVHTHPNHYVCELCGRAFTNSSTLKTHRLLIHIKERNFECVICKLTFPLKSTLNKHVLRHQKRERGEKGFDCTLCEMKYRDKSSLKRHIETKHQGRVQLASCPECPKKYTSKANLMKHRRKCHSIECE